VIFDKIFIFIFCFYGILRRENTINIRWETMNSQKYFHNIYTLKIIYNMTLQCEICETTMHCHYLLHIGRGMIPMVGYVVWILDKDILSNQGTHC